MLGHIKVMALPYDIANSAPRPWATGKFATRGPHYVTLWPQIAALGLPRASLYGSPLAAICGPRAT